MTIQSSRLRPSFHIFQYKIEEQPICSYFNYNFREGKQHLINCFMSTLNHSKSLDDLNKLQEKPDEIRIVD